MAELRRWVSPPQLTFQANELLVRYTGDVNDDLTPMVALMSARG